MCNIQNSFTIDLENGSKWICLTHRFLFADGELYAGTVADFSATDPLILKQKLRTEQYDLKHLNEPHFVSSLEDEDHVYFFFRESAVEFMNCGKVSFLTSVSDSQGRYSVAKCY